MICKDCKHWQGNRGSPWGDCYRIVASLCPEIRGCTNDFGNGFAVPFDPADARLYWKFDERFPQLYREARAILPRGVRVKKWKGNYYFQTNENYEGGCHDDES
jgi:hypothetical protein